MMMFAAVWFGLIGYAMVYSGLRTLNDGKGYSIAAAMRGCPDSPNVAASPSSLAGTVVANQQSQARTWDRQLAALQAANAPRGGIDASTLPSSIAILGLTPSGVS